MAGGEAGSFISQGEFDSVCPRVSSSQMVVYTALATCRGGASKRTVPIGAGLIMKKTGLGRSAVFSALKALDEAGLITRAADGNRCVYGFAFYDQR